MAPRKYSMGARADATAATRQKIVAAAKHLHAEGGIRATSWEEIAARAGVAQATVYRHFPSLAELIPACARSVFDLIKPPSLEEATARFSAIAEPSERLADLVRRSVACYALDEGWLHAAYRERDFIPELDAALLVIQDTLRVLVKAALGRKTARRVEARLFAVCDFPFYKSLLDAGLDRRSAEQTILKFVLVVEQELN